MDNGFAVDETGVTADGYHILPRYSLKAMYVKNVIVFAILSSFTGLLTHYWEMMFDIPKNAACPIIMVIYVLITSYLIIAPQVFYRRYRYRIDDDKAEIRRGIITITHSLVPIERIHQVEVSRGPINRRFGLANVVITTAGGVLTLEYLDDEVAESIASKLNECVVKLLRDRD